MKQYVSAIVFALVVATVPLSTHAAVISQVIFSDPTFVDANWTVVNGFDLVSAGQVATGGNPRSYRQVALFVAENGPFVGQLNDTFNYSPATSGAITGITYTIDLITTNAEGAPYEPLLSQGGNLYIDDVTVRNATSNGWLTHDLVLNPADFGLLTITPFHALIVDHTIRPDFSAAGSPLTFGYEVTAGGAGFFTSVTGIDNAQVTLTIAASPPTAVPEPASLWLTGVGMAAILFMPRQRRTHDGLGATP